MPFPPDSEGSVASRHPAIDVTPRMTMEPAVVNGLPGWVQHGIDGTPLSAASIRVGADGLIAAIHVVRNPHELAYLRRA